MISTNWCRRWKKSSGRCGRRPEHLVVDEGYTTRENILAAAEQGVDLIGSGLEPDAEATDAASAAAWRRCRLLSGPVPLRRRHATPIPVRRASPFAYETTKHERVGVERQVYKARAADCRDCPFRPQCRPGGRAGGSCAARLVPVVAAYVAKMQTEAARSLYRLRGSGGGVLESLAEGQAGAAAVCACAACARSAVRCCGPASPTTFSNGSACAGKSACSRWKAKEERKPEGPRAPPKDW